MASRLPAPLIFMGLIGMLACGRHVVPPPPPPAPVSLAVADFIFGDVKGHLDGPTHVWWLDQRRGPSTYVRVSGAGTDPDKDATYSFEWFQVVGTQIVATFGRQFRFAPGTFPASDETTGHIRVEQAYHSENGEAFTPYLPATILPGQTIKVGPFHGLFTWREWDDSGALVAGPTEGGFTSWTITKAWPDGSRISKCEYYKNDGTGNDYLQYAEYTRSGVDSARIREVCP